MNAENLPLRQTKCATCPFRAGAKTSFVAPVITERIIDESSHICHSTGNNNAFHKRTGAPSHLCRGARDLQLKLFCAMGFLSEPTDEAWNERRVELGMRPTVVKDPVKKAVAKGRK